MSLQDKRVTASTTDCATVLLWQQVHDDLLGDIRSGALAVDDRLPSEFDLADQYER